MSIACVFSKPDGLRVSRAKKGFGDKVLAEAVERAEKGLIDAELGGGLIKQRIARPGKGKSGGYRTVIVYRSGELAVFMYGFAKNVRENIEDRELYALREFAAAWLNGAASDWNRMVSEGVAGEVEYGDEEKQRGEKA
jgi:hypothetical protein